MSFFNIFKKFKGNGALKSAIEKLCKNEIVINMENTKVNNPSSSKVGGKPYLPSDFEWPVFTDKEDNKTHSLSFLCQINLEEVIPYDKDNVLPKNGMLYFFYECESSRWGFDADDKGAAKVFYYENLDGFISLDIPSDITDEFKIPELAISFNSRNSYPMYEEFDLYNKLEPDFEDYDELLEKLGVDLDEEEVNKLLGYANIIQNEILTECERVNRGLYCGDSESYQNTPEDVEEDIEKHASDWTLLFQLGTIATDDFEWMFGDCGMIYFYIKKTDLENKNFDNIHFSVQCG